MENIWKVLFLVVFGLLHVWSRILKIKSFSKCFWSRIPRELSSSFCSLPTTLSRIPVHLTPKSSSQSLKRKQQFDVENDRNFTHQSFGQMRASGTLKRAHHCETSVEIKYSQFFKKLLKSIDSSVHLKVMLQTAQKTPSIWDTFVWKFATKNFQK